MYKGKAIYQPAGKAAEYSAWACNFFKGCSNGCTYCYLKKGRGAKVLGGDSPVLKSCFRDEKHALEVFTKELMQNTNEIRKTGLLFTFTSDPFLPETIDLTFKALNVCDQIDIPVKTLTKCAKWVDGVRLASLITAGDSFKKRVAFGVTLTGHDELEPGASTNQERIDAMRKLHKAGFKTWASIEPIIDFESSHRMIQQTIGFCDLYKIGLMSGKQYDKSELRRVFIDNVISTADIEAKIYFKDSLLKAAGISRESLPENCVNRDYNIFQS